MSDLEVEAVDSVDDLTVASDTPDYVLYGGKGGVGKTTMAAATGLASASEGTSTLVVSTDPAHSLSDTYETAIPTRPERIHDDVPLYAVEIDPEDALQRAGVFGGGGEGAMGGLDALLPGDGDGGMAGMMPGADEAAAMQLLLEYLDDDRFERVVVDTAPTGHTLRLLELPDLLDSMMGRMMKLRQQFSGMMESVKGMVGGEGEGPQQGLDDLDELAERVERLRAVLRNPAKTDFRIVMVPEEMSVSESKRLRAQLDEHGIPVGTVVVNRVMEPLADVTDVPEGTFVSPNVESCGFCKRRWEVQQDALAEAQDLFRGNDVKRVPLFADEVRGETLLRVVASCLA